MKAGRWSQETLNTWIGLFHFVSDWHRYPSFRSDFSLLTYAKQFKLLRKDYLFTDDMIGAFSRESRDELVWLGLPVLQAWNAEAPLAWKGSGPPGSGGLAPQPQPNGVGWPGGTMRCVEQCAPMAAKVGQKVVLTVDGWNLVSDWSLRFVSGSSQVEVPLEGVETSALGQSRVKVSVTFPTAGKYEIGLVDPDDPGTIQQLSKLSVGFVVK